MSWTVNYTTCIYTTSIVKYHIHLYAFLNTITTDALLPISAGRNKTLS